MLIAISGSQGSGKSTVVREFAKRGYSVIQRKTSRSILDEWGVTLNEANTNRDLTIRFQEEITKRKHNDEAMPSISHTLTFTERTHADVFAYALDALGKENEYSEWLDQYYNTCLKNCQVYDKVYYLRAGLFQVEHDGTRGSNKHYSRMIDNSMLNITRQMIHPSKLFIIDVVDLNQRVNIIGAQNDSLWNG